ncbi:hypothetical protein [Helicobacter macacae]|uniref:hypothetical protein n=1 Tax=Helicobacter macacae TaxID=398626 RepID=UPI0004162B88|nr:hypothetical protein [Helicobacter macacae]
MSVAIYKIKTYIATNRLAILAKQAKSAVSLVMAYDTHPQTPSAREGVFKKANSLCHTFIIWGGGLIKKKSLPLSLRDLGEVHLH